MHPWMHWCLRGVVALVVLYFLFSFSLLPLTQLFDDDDKEEEIKGDSHVKFAISVLEQDGCVNGGSWVDVNGNKYPALMVDGCKKSELFYTNSNINSFEEKFTFLGESVGSCWGDINVDGWDDLLILGQEGYKLYINIEGDLEQDYSYFTFSPSYGKGKFCFMTDINADGFLDIFLINEENEFFILQNVKKKSFVDITDQTNLPKNIYGSFVGILQKVLLVISKGNMQLYDYTSLPAKNITDDFGGLPDGMKSALMVDVNNDLAFDVVFLTRHSPPIIAYNMGNYTFFHVVLPEFLGILTEEYYEPQDLAVFDADNNMLPDIFVSVKTATKTLYFIYISTGTHFEVLKIGETENVAGSISHNLAIADYNFDGYVDVAVFDRHTFIFTNNPPTYPHNWIEIELIVLEADTESGVGIGVVANNITQMQIVRSFPSSHKRLHFGLGTSTEISQIFVRWKVFTQRFFDYKPNQLVTILSPYAYKNAHAKKVVGSRTGTQLAECGSGGYRLKPAFLILGIYKSGTTSLAATLARHPQITLGSCKEIHYFDELYTDIPIEWYWSQFPCNYQDYISFEATAGYLYFASVPELVKQHLPNAKFIVSLRDPVDRMYSHYHMNTFSHWEGPIKFDEEARDAVAKFERCIEKQLETLTDDVIMEACADWQFTSANCTYITAAQACAGGGHKWLPFYAGFYFYGVSRWFEYFPREQFMFIHYPDLVGKNFPQTIHNIEEFLGVSTTPIEIYPANISPKREPMLQSTREFLSAVYKPFNLLLYELLKIDYGWGYPKNSTNNTAH